MEKNVFSMIQSTYKKLSKGVLSGKTLEYSPLKSGMRQGCLGPPHL